MIALSSAAARVINMRQTPTQQQTWRAHSGANIAVCAGPARWCFRIDDTGEWRGVSSLVDADAEVSWQNNKMHINGDGTLLKDLEEMWKHNTPRQILSEVFGDALADDACSFANRAADYMDMRDLPIALHLAPTSAEVSDFCGKCAAFSRRVHALSVRVTSL